MMIMMVAMIIMMIILVILMMIMTKMTKKHAIDAGSKQSPVSIKFLVRLRDLNNFLVI